MKGRGSDTSRKAADGRRSQRGTVAVEFALLAVLVMLPLAAGVQNYAGYLGARRAVAVAAREGVLRAARDEDAAAAALAAIAAAGLDPGRAAIEVSSPDAAPGLGSEVGVRVEYDLSGLHLLPLDRFIPRLAAVQATAVARHL